MQRNDAVKAQDGNLDAQIANHIRINTAFEQMIGAVIYGAGLCGFVFFIMNVLTAVFGGYALFDYVIVQFFNALLYTFVIFLTGFLAAGVMITPLFVALEKIPYRRTWPFVFAALIFELFLFFLFFEDFAGAQSNSVYFTLPMFAPGIIITLIFGRLMQPFWQAVARAEQMAADQTLRLH